MKHYNLKNNIFSENYIIKNKINTREIIPGIYFLINKNKIVYIGSSVSPLYRIAGHKKNKQGKIIKFDSHFIINVPKKRLIYYESEMIFKYKPKYNLMIPLNTIKNIIYVGKFTKTFESLKIKRKIKNKIKEHNLNCKPAIATINKRVYMKIN